MAYIASCTHDKLQTEAQHFSNGEVGDKPTSLVHTVDDVGPLPGGVRLADGGAVVHVYVPEADTNTVLC